MQNRNKFLLILAVVLLAGFAALLLQRGKQTRLAGPAPARTPPATYTNPKYRAAQMEWDTYSYQPLTDLGGLDGLFARTKASLDRQGLPHPPRLEDLQHLTRTVLAAMRAPDAAGYTDELRRSPLADVLAQMPAGQVDSLWPFFNAPDQQDSFWQGIAWEQGKISSYRVPAKAVFDHQRINARIMETEANAGVATQKSTFGEPILRQSPLTEPEVDALLLTLLFDCQATVETHRVKRPVSIEFVFHPSLQRWVPLNVSVNFVGKNKAFPFL